MGSKNMGRLEWLPPAIRAPLVRIKRSLEIRSQKIKLKKKAADPNLKIIVGAASTSIDGWHPTNRETLDLLNRITWLQYFKPNSVKAILAEHVWEHLTLEEGMAAAQNCYEFLSIGGYVRAAVPDGYHPAQSYIDAVKPGGFGAGSDDHKILYNYKTFADVFASAGFEIKHLEHFDENGMFVENPWSIEAGAIHRSRQFDERNKDGALAYTSIILDAVKLPAH